MRQSVFATGGIRFVGEREPARKMERRRRDRGDVIDRLLGRVRSLFVFLFVATVFVFAFCHSTDLQNFIVSKLYKWSQAELKSSALRQGALDHENEVNQVVQ